MNLLSRIKYLFSILIIFILLNMNCTTTFPWGNFKRYSLDVPKNLVDNGEEVSGRDCIFTLYQPPFQLFVGSWFWNNLAVATRNALNQSPGAIGLRDAEVFSQDYLFMSCISIKGIPVKEIKDLK